MVHPNSVLLTGTTRATHRIVVVSVLIHDFIVQRNIGEKRGRVEELRKGNGDSTAQPSLPMLSFGVLLVTRSLQIKKRERTMRV